MKHEITKKQLLRAVYFPWRVSQCS